MYPHFSQTLKSSLAALCAMTLGLACNAQATRTATDVPDSKVDIYAGYGYFHPVNSDINNIPYQSIHNLNGTASVTGFFGHYLGFQVEGSYFDGTSPRGAFGQCRSGACSDRDPIVYTAEAGPVLRLPLGRWVPYAHALGGGARINGPYLQKLTWGWGVTGGIGVDYILPYWNNLFAIRPIQADFQYSQVNYGPLVLPAGIEGGFGEIHAVKLSGGIVARFGNPAVKRPVELGCTTQPMNVYAGEPVVANASTVNMNPKAHPIYTWTATGGRISPNDSAATIDTNGLAPGDYTVVAHLSYGKKASQQNTCTSPFTVKSFDPPTVACSATPSTVSSGAMVTISATGTSPQNRPLTFSYATTAGNIVSNGPTATLSTAGLGATSITVTCNLVDDLGKSATASTQVAVQSQPVPVVVQPQSLCTMSFERDRARPARVSNEAKGCLDDIALNLNQRSDAQLFIVANSGPGERPQIAAERALNLRQYLTIEKGIDPTRINLRTGDTSSRTARTMLVPAGTSFDETGTQPFDEHTIRRHGQAYGTSHTQSASPSTRHHTTHHHRASAAATTAAPPQ